MNLGAIAGLTAIVCALQAVLLLEVNVPGSSEDTPSFPVTIGVLAWEAYQQQAFENVVSFEPFYLKDFVGTMPKSK